MIFTITSYSAFDRTTRTTFREAVEVAERYARVGDLPSTITDKHGCRWVVWAGAMGFPPQHTLADCPAVANGDNACDCERIYDPREED